MTWDMCVSLRFTLDPFPLLCMTPGPACTGCVSGRVWPVGGGLRERGEEGCLPTLICLLQSLALAVDLPSLWLLSCQIHQGVSFFWGPQSSGFSSTLSSVPPVQGCQQLFLDSLAIPCWVSWLQNQFPLMNSDCVNCRDDFYVPGQYLPDYAIVSICIRRKEQTPGTVSKPNNLRINTQQQGQEGSMSIVVTENPGRRDPRLAGGHVQGARRKGARQGVPW